MASEISSKPQTPTSRRAILAAAAGAAAGTLASALTRPDTVRATNGEAVLVGGTYSATLPTTFGNTTNTDSVIRAGSTSGTGLEGETSTGVGVRGGVLSAGTGTGVYATAPLTGRALHAVGKVVFSRSGRATMSAGTSTKTISLAGVTTGSLIFAVLGSNRSGRFVRAVVAGSGSFTIYLNTTVLSSTYVFWFVLN